jgi:hypothetical protein
MRAIAGPEDQSRPSRKAAATLDFAPTFSSAIRSPFELAQRRGGDDARWARPHILHQ